VIHEELPASNRDCRLALYRGELFKGGPTASSELLVAEVQQLLLDELGCSDPRKAHEQLSPEDFFRSIGRVRKTLFLDAHYHRRVQEVIADGGFDPEEVAFDPLRLRSIVHQGHKNPRAAPVYYPHRDTWYAHEQGIIAWWIPLDDLEARETFVFEASKFEEPVENDSASFVYEAWVEEGWDLKIGWQDMEAGTSADYPAARLSGGQEEGFACRRAENLLFSGAQFHRTLPQATGLTRYSLDFRILHLPDHAAGLGAPNVDNQSRGAALVDYIKPGRA
jgi:hypothetical protein